MDKPLAIIIPAYKDTFLRAALDSIAAQTCKNFTLYIGDDCSPYDIESIVNDYRDKIALVYNRFDANLGGRDLVAQWERCIDMSQGEEWIWLFSDDDVMEPRCVEEFYKTINTFKDAGLIHFNVSRLHDDTQEITSLPVFPPYCTSKMYLDEKLKGHFVSFVVEFVVRRDIFFDCGRFQNFDLAWGSDFISWVKFSDAANGIVTCSQAKVLWRKSAENISPDKSNPILYRKISSLINNAEWLLGFTSKKGYGNKWFYTKYPLGELVRNRHLLSRGQKKELVSYYVDKIHPSILVKMFVKLLGFVI